MQGVVRRLMERGLVARTDDPVDRRRLSLCLTDDGAEIVRSLSDSALAVSRETLSPLTPKERNNLLKLLKKIM
jgi:DNA-binding MarR family transcriptional regulator